MQSFRNGGECSIHTGRNCIICALPVYRAAVVQSRLVMNIPSSELARRERLVGLWLRLVAALVFAMVVVGGATRLTESGLSIVEWQPVEGVIPPLGEQAWTDAFEAYKQIPQFQQINADMTLSEF